MQMGVLLILLSLLVAVAGAGRHEALATGKEGSAVPYYASSSELNAYWQSLFPSMPIPLAILDHFSAPSGNEKKDAVEEHHWSVYSDDQLPKGDAKILHNWAHRVASEKLLYPEDVLTSGSKINLYIGRAAALHSVCLRRNIADSIPISTKNFTDIAAMFPPASLSMARAMWSTLRSCEHPREVAGEQKACAASVESMREFAASALGTSGLRALSTSLDVPEEGIVSSPSSQRYEVVAVRAVTAAAKGGADDKAAGEANTVTCHSMRFPFALFYCHAVNPTRIYEVTLRREEDGSNAAVPASRTTTTPAMVRALAVCHVNTSGFDPTLRYWTKLGLKPGEASVCHFLTRGDVLWAPAASAAA